MPTVDDHYANLLAPIYAWMAGGPEQALAQGAVELADLGIAPGADAPGGAAPAIDLGAGFGMHAIPLARLGYAVTAIDSSPVLLAELRRLAGGLEVRAIEGNLLEFECAAPAALILCMGDTLTHLQSPVEVERLCVRVAAALAPGGRFIATFRDYTRLPEGDARFIPVRSDAERIHTCFLEEEPDHVLVHDLVHERHGGSWALRASHYRKVRLDPAFVVRTLAAQGLDVKLTSGARGLQRVVAARATPPL